MEKVISGSRYVSRHRLDLFSRIRRGDVSGFISTGTTDSVGTYLKMPSLRGGINGPVYNLSKINFSHLRRGPFAIPTMSLGNVVNVVFIGCSMHHPHSRTSAKIPMVACKVVLI